MSCVLVLRLPSLIFVITGKEPATKCLVAYVSAGQCSTRVNSVSHFLMAELWNGIKLVL